MVGLLRVRPDSAIWFRSASCPVLSKLNDDAIGSRDVSVDKPRWFLDGLTECTNAFGLKFGHRGVNVGHTESEMGDSEAVAVGPVARFGWRCRSMPARKTTKDQNLSTQFEEDTRVSVDIGVVRDRCRLEVVDVELR